MKKRIFTVVAALSSLVVANATNYTVGFSADGHELKSTITEALTAATTAGDTVKIKTGLYQENELMIGSKAVVVGGYTGDDAYTRIYPGAATSKDDMTILDGNAAHRVAEVLGTLEGVVIRNGHVRNDNGGGVKVTGTVQNCIIKGNVAMNTNGTDALGGGVYLDGTDAKLINSVVAFNMANNGYGVAGTGHVINNTITANTYAPVAIPVKGNVGTETPFYHYVHWNNSITPWAESDGFDTQELYFTDFSIAQTQTTTSQFAVFAAAMDLKLEDNAVKFVDEAKGIDILFQVDATYGLHASGMDYIYKAGNANWPMSFVSWYGASIYCEWIGGALPTEGQWEYAARMNANGTINNLPYAGNDEVVKVACYVGNPGGMQEVATKLENGIGLYDMSGNVWEWCADLYATREVNSKDVYPLYANDTDPVNAGDTGKRVVRGGSFGNANGFLSLAFRSSNSPADVGSIIGFRPVIK